MAKKAKETTSTHPASTVTSAARGLYGRVYIHGPMPGPQRYVARIWTAAGVDIWHEHGETRDEAFKKLSDHAREMDEPVELWEQDRLLETTTPGMPL